jgi:hypothetical protein
MKFTDPEKVNALIAAGRSVRTRNSTRLLASAQFNCTDFANFIQWRGQAEVAYEG